MMKFFDKNVRLIFKNLLNTITILTYFIIIYHSSDSGFYTGWNLLTPPGGVVL